MSLSICSNYHFVTPLTWELNSPCLLTIGVPRKLVKIKCRVPNDKSILIYVFGKSSILFLYLLEKIGELTIIYC